MTFDPIKEGATPFDPVKEGATPVSAADFNKTYGNSDNNGPSAPDRGIVGGASDVLRGLGLGAIPTIGAGLFEGGRALVGATQGDNAYKQGGVYGTDQSGHANIQDPFASEEQLGKFSTPVGGAEEALKNTAGLATWALPELKLAKAGEGANLTQKILTGLVNKPLTGAVRGEAYGISQDQGTNPAYAAGGAALEPLLGLLGFLKSGKGTEAGLNKLYSKVHATSAANGNTATENDLLKKVDEYFTQPQNEFKSDALKKEVKRAIQSKTPAPITVEEAANADKTPLPGENVVAGNGFSMGDVPGQTPRPYDNMGGRLASKTGANPIQAQPEMNSGQIHNLRKEIDSAINYSKKAGSPRPQGEQANIIARKILSDTMHGLAPETQQLDNLYALYQKAPFSKIGIPKVGSVKYPSQLKGLPAPVITAIAALLGDKGLKAFTGKGL